MRRVLWTVAAAALVAGCGADVASPYSAKATAPCLEKARFRVSRRAADIGVIAAAADHGGLLAVVPGKGNNVTIAFGGDTHDALDIARAYRRLAPPRVRKHLRDILSRQRNAILVWTVAPTQRQLQTVQQCLAS
jgi:hypothetical protein